MELKIRCNVPSSRPAGAVEIQKKSPPLLFKKRGLHCLFDARKRLCLSRL
jgi:hypothetical protein